jgi:orotate phosphoribosyltransferase
MSDKLTNAQVLETLKHCDALLEGHFLLSSGRHSDRYFQCARLFLHPDKAATVMSTVAAKLKADMAAGKIAFDAVCGPALGGILPAYELGRQLGLPALFTERDDTGAMCLRRGFEVKPGQKFLIAEDVVTTGKSSGEAKAVIEAAGGRVVALSCVVDRRDGDQGITLPLYAACKVTVGNWDPADCGLCKAGTPAVKPGSRKQQ